MKKIVSYLILFILSGSIFSGCVKHADDKPLDTNEVSQEKITIRFVWNNLPDENKRARDLAVFGPFQVNFPHIKVDFQTIPNWRETIKVQIAANEGPDLFTLDPNEVVDYAKDGSILSFDRYVSKYEWDKLIFNWALETGKYDGKQYTIPHAYECSFLFYNKDLLDANGWPVPETRAEFESVCSEALKKGITPIAYGNAGLPILNHWLIDHYMGRYSGNEAVRDLFTGKIGFTDPRIKGAFQLLQEDWEKGWWNEKKTAGVTMEEARALWADGKALFNCEGSWFTEYISKGVDFEFSCTRWPSMREGVPPAVSVGVGAVIAASKNSKVQDESAELLNFMYGNEKLIAEGIALGLQPLAREINPKLIPPMKKELRIILDSLLEHTEKQDVVGYAPWTYFPVKTAEYLYKELDKVFYNRLELNRYLEEAQRILDKEISEGFKFRG